MLNDYETARASLGAAMRERVSRDPDFRSRCFEARTELDQQGASVSADTLDALIYLAAELGLDLQDGLSDALALLSHGSAVSVWPHLPTSAQQTLDSLSNGNALELLAKLMVDFAVQWQA